MAKTKVTEKGAKEPITVPIQMQQAKEAADKGEWEKVVSIGAGSKSEKVAMYAAERLAENGRFDEFTELFELRRIKEAAGKDFWRVVTVTGINTKSDRVAMAAAKELVDEWDKCAMIYLGLSTPSDKARDYIVEELKIAGLVPRLEHNKLLDYAKDEYEGSPLLGERERKEFFNHTEEVLSYVSKFSVKAGLNEKERKIAEIAAVLHDLGKTRAPPPEASEVRLYVLANHHEMGAAIVDSAVSDDFLGKNGFAKEEFAEVREAVKQCIREHMGPHPGFMTDVLNGVNRELAEKGLPQIVHPQPSSKPSQVLFAADMASMISENGIRKILAIRADKPAVYGKHHEALLKATNKTADQIRYEEYALLSVLKSGEDVVGILSAQNPRLAGQVKEMHKEALRNEYRFPGNDFLLEPAKVRGKLTNEEFSKVV